MAKKRTSIKWNIFRCLWLLCTIVSGLIAIVGSGSPPKTDVRESTLPYREQIDPQNIAMEIKKEKETYSKEYLLDALDVIGKCDKFLNTPKYQMYSVSSEIKTSFQKLKINHDQYANSALNKYLSELTTKISTVCDNAKYVDEQDSRGGGQADYDGAINKLDEIGILLKEIRLLISGINLGL